MGARPGPLPPARSHGPTQARSTRDPRRHLLDPPDRRPWRDLPEELGPWATTWDLFDTWNGDGTLEAILSRLRAAGIDAGLVDRELWCVDGTVVRAARCAGGGGKADDPEEPADHALGRSRGGFSTKIHLLCDGHGHPLDFHLTPGQAHEATGLVPLLEGAEDRVVDGDDEPVAWPVALAGDKGFRADWIDEYLLELGMRPVIPSKENEDRAARAVEFDREAYRRRSIVECLIGWLKECRRVLLAVREDGQELRRDDQDGVHPTLSTPVSELTVFRHSLASPINTTMKPQATHPGYRISSPCRRFQLVGR